MKVKELIDKLKQGNLEHDVFVSPLKYFNSIDDTGPKKLADPFQKFPVETVAGASDLRGGLDARTEFVVIGFELPDRPDSLATEDEDESVH